MVPTQQYELHGEQFNSRVLDIFGSNTEWVDDECIRLVFGKLMRQGDTGDAEYVFVNP